MSNLRIGLVLLLLVNLVHADGGAPTIVSQSNSTTAIEGSATALFVEATGDAPLTYAWFKDGEAIDQATSATHPIDPITTADTGRYVAKVTNATGTAESRVMLLDVSEAQAPSVNLYRGNENVVVGQNFQLNGYISGSAPLTYQWYKNDVPIPDATEERYRVNSAALTDSGAYHLRVTNFKGAVRSSLVIVTVSPRTAPRFTSQPRSEVERVGNNVGFSFSYSGTEPIQFQLLRDGNVVTSGSSRYSLSLTSVQPSDEGTYQIRMANAAGEVSSDPFRIVVEPRTSEDLSVSISGPSHPLTEGSTLSLNGYVSSSRPVIYQWLKNGAEIPGANDRNYNHSSVSQSSVGAYSLRVSDGDIVKESSQYVMTLTGSKVPVIVRQPTSLKAIRGATNFNLSVSAIGANPLVFQWYRNGTALPGEQSSNLELHRFDESEITGTYTVSVSNTLGSEISEPAVVELIDGALPAITRQPSNQHIPWRSSAHISINVVSDTSYSVEWYRNGNPLNRGSNSLSLSNFPGTNVTGIYYAEVTNTSGTATTTSFTVTAEGESDPANWFINRHPPHFALTPGEERNMSVQLDGDYSNAVTYQWFHNGEPIAGANSQSYRVFGEPHLAGEYHVLVQDGARSAESERGSVWVGLRAERPLITYSAGSIDRRTTDYETLFVNVRDNLSPSGVVWRLDGTPLPQYGDDRLNVPQIAAAAGTYTAEVTYLNETQTAPPIIVRHVDEGDQPSSRLRIINHPTGASTHLGQQVYLSVHTNVNASYQWFKDGEPIPLATNQTIELRNLTAAQTGVYQVQVTNGDETIMSGEATVTSLPASLPVITRQPSSLVMSPQSYSTTVSVVASGNPSPTYQWYHEGIAVSDQRSSNFSVRNTTPAGNYYVVVSNASGQVQSDTFSLAHSTTASVPQIAVQPVSVYAAPGDLVQFRVQATGEDPITYQWNHNGSIIPGAQGSSLTVEDVNATDSGAYTVTVSNNQGATSSLSAFLTLEIPEPPEIRSHPTSRTVDAGNTTIFTVGVISRTPATYQWMRNGVALFDATGPSLTLADVSAGQAGLYQVVVTNAGGSVTSQGARLDITQSGPAVIARHHLVGNGFNPGEEAVIRVHIAFAGSPSALGFQVMPPEGWSFSDDNLDGTTVAPSGGDTELLEWAWSDIPSSPITFDYYLHVPENADVPVDLVALVESRQDGDTTQALGKPDPLTLSRAGDHHTADMDRNGNLGLSELLRVIELYNTRYGSARTGRYHPHDETMDGFAPDATKPGTAENIMTRHHLADTDRNGHLSLAELLRVIELYNHRDGTTRTGAYRRAAGTVDGFAPDAGGE